MTAAEWTKRIDEEKSEVPFGTLWHEEVVSAIIEDLRQVEEELERINDYYFS